MTLSTDIPIREMTTFELQELADLVQDELHDRAVQPCKDAMKQLVELIERVQAQNFDIELTDIDGNGMQLNHITDIWDNQFDIGFTFGNHPDITGDSSIAEDKLKYDDHGNIICIHADDDIPCCRCAVREECWGRNKG